MRYPPEQKARSRAKLVAASAAHAKREGFAAAGVDALAQAAGLTSGAFYRHFGGKADLLSAIVETELAATRSRFAALDREAHDELSLAIDAYLSLAHVRNPQAGCLLPTLAAEIARAPSDTKAVFERAMHELNAVLRDKIGDAAAASALVSLCAGAVMIARALETEEAKREVLRAARHSAKQLVAAARRP